MIRRANEMTAELITNMRGGEGTVEKTAFVSAAELNDKGRLFGRIVLHPGCGIGYHVHEADSEVFFVVKGTAVYDDNGTVGTISAGDATLCPAGTGHSVRNGGTEDVELIALIVNA